MTPVEAWSAVVAGEDAAIYAYSVAGGRVQGAARRQALAGLEAHRAQRSRAAALVVAAGGTPPPPAAAYQLPDDVRRPRGAKAAMADVDNALVAVYADAAGATTGDDRRWAARTAADCAVLAVAWGAAPQAFPT
jgi:Domain of unknown function (DUF4439)